MKTKGAEALDDVLPGQARRSDMSAWRADTIPHRLLRRRPSGRRRSPIRQRSNGRWQPTTWRTYVDQVRTAARALIALGLPRGGKVAILGFNRPEWVIFDHAAMMAGGAPAGIYTTCSADEVQYIVHHSESRVVLVENADAAREGQGEARASCRCCKWIVMMRGATATGGDVLTWDDFLAKAESVARGRRSTSASTRSSRPTSRR